jgi:hypothetical protein
MAPPVLHLVENTRAEKLILLAHLLLRPKRLRAKLPYLNLKYMRGDVDFRAVRGRMIRQPPPMPFVGCCAD